MIEEKRNFYIKILNEISKRSRRVYFLWYFLNSTIEIKYAAPTTFFIFREKERRIPEFVMRCTNPSTMSVTHKCNKHEVQILKNDERRNTWNMNGLNRYVLVPLVRNKLTKYVDMNTSCDTCSSGYHSILELIQLRFSDLSWYWIKSLISKLFGGEGGGRESGHHVAV